MSKPWMKFYPSDWRSDPALRMCPLAARGLWMEMLSIMHEADPYGHLVVKGVAVEPGMLAKMVGIGLKECRNLLATLRQVGVFSETEAGVIYSRRMTRDYAKALRDKEFGKKGGNPALTGGVNPTDKAQKPEARDQIPELDLVEPTEPSSEKSESDKGTPASRSSRAAKKYFFESGIIRLTEEDYKKWEQAFDRISLPAALIGLEGYAATKHAETGKWYWPVQKVLSIRNEEARLAVEKIKADAVARANAPAPKKPAYLGP